MAATEREGTADVGGRSLAWRASGSGPPLLLINGYAATAADWDPNFFDALTERFEVIRPDNRGVGGSALGDAVELTIDSMASDVEAVLDGLGIESALIVGWSMGGFIAQRLAQRAPERLSAMVLLSTDPGGAAAVPAEAEVWAKLTDHSGSAREQATRLLISLLFPPELAPEIDRQFGDIVAAARAELSPVAMTAQERAMADWHVKEPGAVGPNPPPVLIAHGTSDVVIPPENADALAARWPACRIERFAGGGHAFMALEPVRAADLIGSLVAE